MKKMVICCIFFLGLNGTAFCAQMSKIELTSGNVIEAEIISFENGTYTLNASGIGEIKVEASKIKKIEMLNVNTPPADNPADLSNIDLIKSKVDELKPKVTGNPELMKTISALILDPDFQEVLKDEDILKAAKSEDIKTLMSNPKFMSLINHPKIKEIKDTLKGQESQ